MKNISDYRNKKVLVLGLAKSGVNAARLLHPIRSHQVLLQKSRPWNFMQRSNADSF